MGRAGGGAGTELTEDGGVRSEGATLDSKPSSSRTLHGSQMYDLQPSDAGPCARGWIDAADRI